MISQVKSFLCPDKQITVVGGKISYFSLARKFNSTLNFTQSGWTILFIPDLLFRAANWISCKTHSLWLENAVQCRRHTGRSSLAITTLFSWTTPPSVDVSLGALLAAAAAWTHEGTYLIYGFLARNPSSYLPNPSARAGYDTRSIFFKRSLRGLNSEFSFS